MPTQSSKKYILIGVAIVLIALGAFYLIPQTGTTEAWTAYEQKEAGIDFKYPPGWHVFSNLSQNNPCCVFVLNYQESATTTFSQDGNIKLQIGLYDTSTFDPFKLGSTTVMTIGKNSVYAGAKTDTPFYILPRTPTTGVGIAVFSSAATQKEAIEDAQKIISTLNVHSLDTAISTSTVK